MIKQTCNYLALVALAVFAIFAATVFSQSSTKNKPPTGAISGHVTLEDKPVAGVSVVANPCENGRYLTEAPAATATTDGDGVYRLTGLAAAHYCVSAFAPAWVAQTKPGVPGVHVNLSSGETVDDIDLALKKGGVITGRVLDTDGQPVISEFIQAALYDLKGNQVTSKSAPTDDRGVYRIYGLTPGKYKVQAGQFDPDGGTAIGGHQTHLATYYAEDAGVTDPSRAKFVNVSIEDEATDIDITVQTQHTYAVSGSVVNEQTGQGVPGLRLDCSIRDSNGRPTRILTNPFTTDAKGGFSLSNLTAGHYILRLNATDGVNLYGDPVQFDITESNVSGLIVKAKTGASVSGRVVVNSTDPDLINKVSKLYLAIQSSTPPGGYTVVPAKIAADGTFHAEGVVPGNAEILLSGYGPQQGFRLIRVERGGAEVKNRFQISAGEAISDFRVIAGFGTGIVRGTMKIEGNPIPPEMRFRLSITLLSGGQRFGIAGDSDARGQFIFRNLLPGQYVVEITTNPLPERAPVMMSFADAKKTVEVADGSDISVALTLVLSPKSPKGEKP